MELSKRLAMIASLVTEGASVADIGTDHGYIPIYLVKNNIASKAIAMDINGGPLLRAKENIIKYNLENKIETRLSDGLEQLEPGETDTIIIAGMGGDLMMAILDRKKEVVKEATTLILQPQSKWPLFRRYLHHEGFKIQKEEMVFEDGKFYFIMHVMKGEEKLYSEVEEHFGRRLLESKNPILLNYLKRESQIKENILASLGEQKGDKIQNRIEEVKKEILLIREAEKAYEM